MTIAPLNAIFFDLDKTLVRQRSAPVAGRAFEWIDEADLAFEELRATGVRVGFISDTGGLTRARLFELLPADLTPALFDDNLMVMSSEVGAEKPAATIFARAIDQARLPPMQCLFCTEDLSHVLAAQQLGIRAVWVPIGHIAPFIRLLIQTDVVA